MSRVLRYQVADAEKGLRLGSFLRRRGYAQGLLAALRQSDGVRVNGRLRYMRDQVFGGDIIQVCLPDDRPSLQANPGLQVPVLYEDEDILVVNKPARLPVHPSINHRNGTLANRIAGYYHRQGIAYVFRCMNRLDRDTSGLVLLAKHMLSGAILSKCVKEGGLHREYRAVVCGKLPEKGTITAPIGRKPDSIIERMVDTYHGQRAVTHYQRIGYGGGYSYVSIQLETGRTHQIRVHMKHIGHPLPGDFLYYPDFTHIGRQALHSYRIWFPHPITGKEMEFVAEVPEDMRKMIK